MRIQQIHRVFLLGFFLFLLSACALTPKSADSRISSDALLAQQFATVERALEKTAGAERLVLYVGSAQHSQSLAFQGDVLLVQKRLQAVNPKVQSIILSNEAQTSQLVYPFATLHSLDQTFARIAAWSRKYPLTLVVLVTTHGNVDLLSTNVANEYYAPVRSSHLRPWLDAVGDTPTVLILSACHSGSFIPKLAASQRIVLAAAASDRISFGCNYQSENTYFIGEMFGPGFDPNASWQQSFDRTRSGIEQKERAMRMGPPSNPQGNIPDAFAQRTIVDFLRP